MANWSTITTASILTTLSNAEYSKYSTTSTGSMYNSGSLVQEIIDDTIAEVRSFIQGCPRNAVSDNLTLIPASCIPKAKSIIVYRIMMRVAGKISDVNDVRKDDYNKAYDFLTSISEGKIGVDHPTVPVVNAQYDQFFGTSETPIRY